MGQDRQTFRSVERTSRANSSFDETASQSSGETSVFRRRLPVGMTPPLTPKMQRNTAIECTCDSGTIQGQAYGNYDIPKQPIRVASPTSAAMQFYDTPKTIQEQIEKHSGPYANYDVPHPGEAPVPIVQRPCGCIMRLLPQDSEKTLPESKQIPKLKLTGSGKMPVMDMRNPEHSVVTGLPPKSPVYAVVNKASKRKIKTNSQAHNYCNIEPNDNIGATGKPPAREPPTEPFYENSREVLDRMFQDDLPNYVEMEPKEFRCPNVNSPLDSVFICESRSSNGSIDPINQRLRDMADRLNDPSVNYYCQQSSNSAKTEPKQCDSLLKVENFVTMPRHSKSLLQHQHQQPVTMRRSSSVPCKRVSTTRGSTSSSDDSGFSPGSPNVDRKPRQQENN